MAKCENCYHYEMCCDWISRTFIPATKEEDSACERFKDKDLIAELHHGEWKINCDDYYPYCSECKNEPPGRIMTDYCPRCGAKMNNNDK